MKCEACEHENLSDARYCAKCGALLPTQVSEADPMIGKVIGGRFRVTGILGEGGMGIVYEGEQPMGSTTRKVAIKTLHAHLSKDPSVLARFHRECGTVAQLEHPNTIKVYDFGSTDDGILYIAMEFVAGESLNKAIERGPLPPDRTVKIMRQVCGALEEAHSKGIIHRDLKPENVVLTNRAGETDFVKVLDFGIAARTESADASKEQKLTQQGMVLGTPPYMSPEQFTGKALDARSDIYSLGVMCYELLTSRLPFDADTPWQWATQHMTAQPIPFEVAAPARNIPDGMRTAILRAMSKDREERQETARQFFSQLSEGERMTAEQAAAAPKVRSTGTAAMDAAPDFMSGGMGGAPVPAPPPQFMAGQPTPMAMAPAVHVPPPPAAARKGGGKGLVIGLATLGLGLLVAIVIIAARSMRPSTDDTTLNLGTTGSASSGVAIAPMEAPTTETPTTDTAVANPAPGTPTSPKQGGTTTHATGSTGGTTSGTAASSTATSTAATGTTTATTATATATSTSTAASGGGAACDACISAAGTGNIASAAASYRSCTDAAKKTQCTNVVRSKAPGAAQSLALNGQCPAAKAIVAAAASMGAVGPRFDAAIKNCH